MLMTGRKVISVELLTPKGIKLCLDVNEQKLSDDSASCSIVKDSGDDPDITNGISVFAEVSTTVSGVEIIGGKGIGRVTKAGLDQPVGEAAINTVPRRMIYEAVS